MTVISVEIPDNIARNFKKSSIIKYEDLLKYQNKSLEEQLTKLDGKWWTDIEIEEDAWKVLDFLKNNRN